jgi:hypothetical protein
LTTLTHLAKKTVPSARARETVGAAVGYEIDPDVVYPAALDELEHLLDLLDAGDPIPEKVRQHVALAASVADRTAGFEAARASRDDCPPVRRQDRATLLDAARLLVTALLHEEAGEPIGVRILNRPDWRL